MGTHCRNIAVKFLLIKCLVWVSEASSWKLTLKTFEEETALLIKALKKSVIFTVSLCNVAKIGY